MYFRVLFITLLTLFSICLNTAVAQNSKNGEIGLSLGGSYYLGDLNKMPFANTQLAFGAFYKHNLDTRFSLKGVFNYGKLAGEADNTIFSQVNAGAVTNFTNTFYELNSLVEFNFIPYLAANRKYTYTPYVFAGLGFMYYPNGASIFKLSIPFGLGFKYNVYKNFIVGMNVSMSKTFADNLDYEYSPPNETNVFMQYGYAGNKDWYSVCGIYLAYKIKYRVKCPAFD